MDGFLFASSCAMWQRTFGHIPGIPVGSTFANRIQLSLTRVHRPRRAGISGSASEGADSIVIAGAYEDDLDEGKVIIYAGHGGRDAKTGKQAAHQTITGYNAALVRSFQTSLPVRVIRGATEHSVYAPAEGYRYDGLYKVNAYWQEKGKSGYGVWFFRLVKTVD